MGRAGLAAVGVACAIWFGGETASAATTLGTTPTPNALCTAGLGFAQLSGPSGATPAAPTNGVITSWSFTGATPIPVLRLKVWRPVAGGQYTAIAKSDQETPAVGANTFPTRIP